MEKILFLSDVNNNQLSDNSLEALSCAMDISQKLESTLNIALFGESVTQVANSLNGLPIENVFVVEGDAFRHSRYASDAAGITSLIKEAKATIVISPACSRLNRSLPGAALRCGGKADSHISDLHVKDKNPAATRWFYRQRIEANISRKARPWILAIEPGIFPKAEPKPGSSPVISIATKLSDEETATSIQGIESPSSNSQTIKPDAELLFVAGAGWTKKQSSGMSLKEAENLILGFINKAQASLGSSKSLVDQSAEGQEILPFMTHLNQIGQTGASPRHAKGLATCCHGEEPHVVGWRFINQRRAVNLDENCGWAQGKADVLYVADAFEVIEKINNSL